MPAPEPLARVASWYRSRMRRLVELPLVQRAAAAIGPYIARLRKDRVGGLAAEVAFWATLSAFPLLLAIGAALGSLRSVVGAARTERVREQFVEWIGDALGSTSNELARSVGSLFDRPSPGLLSIGIAVLLWSASRAFGSLIRALDVIYRVEERRSWLRIRLTALALALGSVVVASAAMLVLVLGPLLGRGSDVAASVGLDGAYSSAWALLRFPFAVVVLLVWATTVFHFAPSQRTPWRWDLPGAALTAVLWMLGHLGLLVYLELASGSANAVFGILGGALSLLLWLYVLALGALLGGELNAALARGWVADADERRGGSRRGRA